LQFSLSVQNYQPVNPRTTFQNPVGRLFASFSYDFMTDGVQWSAVWFRNGEMVFSESGPWEGGTGGYGYSEWNPPAEDWIPGVYQVVLYVGEEWKVLGEFRVVGDPPTPTVTPTPSLTPLPSSTPLPSWTPRPSDTRWPSPTAPQ
jgi:type VI secretion system secreted protein VgrG